MESFQTLFLDRDGVINVERPGDYVKTYEEFTFLPGVKGALAKLSPLFSRIVIVTNQRGVGYQRMSREDLDGIHREMLREIGAEGGRIDAIYVCTDVEPGSPNRKPNIGMALQAKADFPEIDFARSVLVGNSKSDLQFGRNAGMTTVLLGNKYAEHEKDPALIDYAFENLLKFAEEYQRNVHA